MAEAHPIKSILANRGISLTELSPGFTATATRWVVFSTAMCTLGRRSAVIAPRKLGLPEDVLFRIKERV